MFISGKLFLLSSIDVKRQILPEKTCTVRYTRVNGDQISWGPTFYGTKKVRGQNENIKYTVDLRTLYRPVVWMKEY